MLFTVSNPQEGKASTLRLSRISSTRRTKPSSSPHCRAIDHDNSICHFWRCAAQVGAGTHTHNEITACNTVHKLVQNLFFFRHRFHGLRLSWCWFDVWERHMDALDGSYSIWIFMLNIFTSSSNIYIQRMFLVDWLPLPLTFMSIAVVILVYVLSCTFICICWKTMVEEWSMLW